MGTLVSKRPTLFLLLYNREAFLEDYVTGAFAFLGGGAQTTYTHLRVKSIGDVDCDNIPRSKDYLLRVFAGRNTA